MNEIIIVCAGVTVPAWRCPKCGVKLWPEKLASFHRRWHKQLDLLFKSNEDFPYLNEFNRTTTYGEFRDNIDMRGNAGRRKERRKAA